MPSFDIVSKVDLQEVDNAINQARKEVTQRYDFKGSKTTIERGDEGITIVSDDDFKVGAVVDVLQSKLVRRGVDLKSLDYGKVEPAGGGLARQAITLKQGLVDEKAKQITKSIKELKLKAQAQIQGDQVRVTAKKRDDLQSVIQELKGKDFDLPLQFVNFRD